MDALLLLEFAFAAAQVEVDVGTGVGSVVGNAVGAFATTLVVGVILVAIAPGYLEARVDELEADPLSAFLAGSQCSSDSSSQSRSSSSR